MKTDLYSDVTPQLDDKDDLNEQSSLNDVWHVIYPLAPSIINKIQDFAEWSDVV